MIYKRKIFPFDDKTYPYQIRWINPINNQPVKISHFKSQKEVLKAYCELNDITC